MWNLGCGIDPPVARAFATLAAMQSTMKDLKLKVLDEVERAAPAELAVLEKWLLKGQAELQHNADLQKCET